MSVLLHTSGRCLGRRVSGHSWHWCTALHQAIAGLWRFLGKQPPLPPPLSSSTHWGGGISFLTWKCLKDNANIIDCSWDPDDISIPIVTEILMDCSNCSENDDNNTIFYFCGEWGWIGDSDCMAMKSDPHVCDTYTSHRGQSEEVVSEITTAILKTTAIVGP